MVSVTNYLSFLLGSTNHHGVHSPFLFSYLTQCLYPGKWDHPSRAIGIAVKSIPYFGMETAGFFPANADNKSILTRAFPNLRTENPPFDLLMMEQPDPLLPGFDAANSPCYHNNTLCIIEHIRGNRQQRHNWEAVKSLEQVTVTVDAFSCGLVFFRKELSGQHFKIRI